jgi:hypothetical protein
MKGCIGGPKRPLLYTVALGGLTQHRPDATPTATAMQHTALVTKTASSWRAVAAAQAETEMLTRRAKHQKLTQLPS